MPRRRELARRLPRKSYWNDLAEMVADAVVEDSAGTAGLAEMAGTGNQAVVRDAIEALVVLGYPKTDAARAVRSVELSEDLTVEELLKKSLKNI